MGAERAVERRIVSVLFADLVGFTSLSEQLDAEDVAAVQGAYFDTVRETIERYDGRLEKFIGDAAMAVFGVPRTRDDDAERAVRAGLALTAAIEQLAARIGLESGALAVRVGVNTGEVVHTPHAGPEEAIVTGDPVNVAARLQAAAETGQVLLGETAALAVAAAVDLDEPQALELKGKSEPVLARRAVSVRPEHSRDAAMGSLRAPLLGRERDLSVLLGEAERARTQPRRVLVVAPPGVGKTRLVDEVAARTANVARARLRPDVLAPFEPVAQLLSSAGAAEEGFDDALRRAGIAPARVRVIAEEVLAVFRPDAAGGVGVDRESRFLAWLEAMDALADVWIVEDVHWAGADLLAFLAFAGEQAGGRLILSTSRPSLLETAAEWCLGAAQLDLLTLPPAAASELVRALVGDALPDELVARIGEASDGNPLFIEELLRTWISVGTLVSENGDWKLARPAADVPLPQTVQAIYAAQLDDLPSSAREVARRAAVAGRRFAVAALEPLEVVDAGAGVDLLARRALVSGPSADSLFGPSYVYRHALLRDAGYASLARAERARLHARLAVWLEGAAGGSQAQVAEPIARHYAQALASMPALARDVAGLARDDCRRLAASWFSRAAEAARDLAAHESARELLGRALELTSKEEPVERSRRLTVLGQVTASTADMDEGARLLGEALELARTAADRTAIARAAAELSYVLDKQVQFMPAARTADSALAEIGARDDVDTALLLIRRANAVSNGSDAVNEPLADGKRALDIARAHGDRRLELEALNLVVSLESGGEDEWKALERLALETQAWDTAIDAMHTQALRLAPDHAADAAPITKRAIEVAEARGLRENLAWLHQADVEIGLASGEWDAAIEAGRRGLDIGVANGYDRAVVRTWSALLPIASARGDPDLLDMAYAWLTERFREPENPSPYARVMWAARQLEIARRGLRQPFLPDVEERLVSFELRYSSPSWLAALETVVDAWLEGGESDGAGRALDRLESSAGEPGMAMLGRSTYWLLRSKWLTATGADGAEEAGRALEGFRVSKAPWWIAKALRLLHDPEAVEIERALGIPAL